jgi:hypothetical protein
MQVLGEARAPLQLLHDAYRDPMGAAREAHDGGATIIARIGVGIPEEMILASGAFATVLFPQATAPTPIADELMDPGEQQDLRSLLDQIASPDQQLLSLAVIAPPYSALAATIEDLRRAALLPNAVPTSYFELPAIEGSRSLLYAADRMRALSARISSVTGRPATQATLLSAITTTNRRRRALQAFVAARRGAPVISGLEAFRAIGAANLLPSAMFSEALEAATAALEPDPGLADRARILLVPSSPLTHDRAHVAIEEAGALIIAEDDPLGSRAAEPLIREDGDTILAMTEHYLENMTGARVFPAKRRLHWFHTEAIKPDVDAVIFYAQEARYGWDFPAMRDYLDTHGKPSAFIRADAQQASGFAQLASETRAFLDQISANRGGIVA